MFESDEEKVHKDHNIENDKKTRVGGERERRGSGKCLTIQGKMGWWG